MPSRRSRRAERSAIALAADVACLARTQGLAGALRKVREGLARSSLEVVVLEKRLDEIAEIDFAPRLRLAELDRRALPALADFNRARCDTRANRRFARNLDRGYRGFVAYRGEAVAGYYWWVDGRIDARHEHLRALEIALSEDEVYGFDFLLAPEHRGHGHAVEFLHGVETRLRDRGYRALWGYVRSDNRPARWLYGLRGYEAARTVRVAPHAVR